MVGWSSSSSKERKGVLRVEEEEEEEDLCFWILMAGITHLGPQAERLHRCIFCPGL